MFWRLIVGVSVVVLLCLAMVWQWLQYEVQQPLDMKQAVHSLTVPAGGNLNQTLQTLESQGLLPSIWPLKLFAKINKRGHIRAGEYDLKQGDTALDVLIKLESGAVKYHQITFSEGLSVDMWLALLASRDSIRQTKGLDKKSLITTFGITENNPEGWFAPETYSFTQGESDLSVLKQAHIKMKKILADAWRDRAPDLPYKTPYEALIMASIVEKETGVAIEREAIAGVFVRRLQKPMRLQTDPTVIYGLGSAYTGNLRRKHLRSASPYNTYRINGLPPTPITNPGAAAIKAALHPKAGDALYFVAKGNGEHYFSSTLKEHQRAVQKYQINERRKNYSSTVR